MDSQDVQGLMMMPNGNWIGTDSSQHVMQSVGPGVLVPGEVMSRYHHHQTATAEKSRSDERNFKQKSQGGASPSDKEQNVKRNG